MKSQRSSEEAACPACSARTTERSEELRKSLSNRLSRIEGQIRGLQRMLEENAYCIDIISQASAASSALNSFSKELLAHHIRTCVKEDVSRGNDAKLDELVGTLRKLMR